MNGCFCYFMYYFFYLLTGEPELGKVLRLRVLCLHFK